MERRGEWNGSRYLGGRVFWVMYVCEPAADHWKWQRADRRHDFGWASCTVYNFVLLHCFCWAQTIVGAIVPATRDFSRIMAGKKWRYREKADITILSSVQFTFVTCMGIRSVGNRFRSRVLARMAEPTRSHRSHSSTDSPARQQNQPTP